MLLGCDGRCVHTFFKLSGPRFRLLEAYEFHSFLRGPPTRRDLEASPDPRPDRGEVAPRPGQGGGLSLLLLFSEALGTNLLKALLKFEPPLIRRRKVRLTRELTYLLQ